MIKLFQRRPGLVVDLGCGTGLSTRPWAEFSDHVVGIDPSDEMLDIARQMPIANVTYRKGVGNDTKLEDHSVDIATCSSSIHWMEPETTINEILRVLKKDGMLLLFGHNWPPLSHHLDLDNMFFKFKAKKEALVKELNLYKNYFLNIEDFSKHLHKLSEFCVFREFYFHEETVWIEKRYIGFIHSFGNVQLLLQNNVPKSEFHLDELEQKIKEIFSNNEEKLLFSWRVDLFKDLKINR